MNSPSTILSGNNNLPLAGQLEALLVIWDEKFRKHIVKDIPTLLEQYNFYKELEIAITNIYFDYVSVEDMTGDNVKNELRIGLQYNKPLDYEETYEDKENATLHKTSLPYEQEFSKLKDILSTKILERSHNLTVLKASDKIFSEDEILSSYFYIISGYTSDKLAITLDEAFANKKIRDDITHIMKLQTAALVRAISDLRKSFSAQAQKYTYMIEDHKQGLHKALTQDTESPLQFIITPSDTQEISINVQKTINTIWPFVLGNGYTPNIMLGYNFAENRIMTLQEKRDLQTYVENTYIKDDEIINIFDDDDHIPKEDRAVKNKRHRDQKKNESPRLQDIYSDNDGDTTPVNLHPAVKSTFDTIKKYSLETHSGSPYDIYSNIFGMRVHNYDPIHNKGVRSELKTIVDYNWENRCKKCKIDIRRKIQHTDQSQRATLSGRYLYREYQKTYNNKSYKKAPYLVEKNEVISEKNINAIWKELWHVFIGQSSWHRNYPDSVNPYIETMEKIDITGDWKDPRRSKISVKAYRDKPPLHGNIQKIIYELEIAFEEKYKNILVPGPGYNLLPMAPIWLRMSADDIISYNEIYKNKSISDYDLIEKLRTLPGYKDLTHKQMQEAVDEVRWIEKIESLKDKDYKKLNQISIAKEMKQFYYWLEESMQSLTNIDFTIEPELFHQIAYKVLHKEFISVRTSGIDQYIDWTLTLRYKSLVYFAQEKNIDISCLHEACQQVYKHIESKSMGYTDLEMLVTWATINSIPLSWDKENCRKLIQSEYEKKVNGKNVWIVKNFHTFETERTSFDILIQEIDSILSIAKSIGVEIDITNTPSLEDAYVKRLTTPRRISPHDIELDRYGDCDDSSNGNMTQITDHLGNILQAKGSLLTEEKALQIDVRKYFNIPKERWHDIDQKVIWNDIQPAARVIIHANWAEDLSGFEGNYIMYIDPKTKELTLLWDTELQNHNQMRRKYNIPPTILGGGYAKLNKNASILTLGSYMPEYYHEPRIITATLLKNILENIVPDLKLLMAHDGLQDMGKEYCDSENSRPWAENPWVPQYYT